MSAASMMMLMATMNAAQNSGNDHRSYGPNYPECIKIVDKNYKPKFLINHGDSNAYISLERCQLIYDERKKK